jgi:hypothetical protein
VGYRVPQAASEALRQSLRSASIRLLRWHQPSSQQVEVGQGERGVEPRGVLRQAPVADLGKSPKVLHHVKGVLDARPGREHKTTFLCEAGLSAQQLSERLLVEAAVSPTARPRGSAFLYVIRSLSR